MLQRPPPIVGRNLPSVAARQRSPTQVSPLHLARGRQWRDSFLILALSCVGCRDLCHCFCHGKLAVAKSMSVAALFSATKTSVQPTWIRRHPRSSVVRKSNLEISSAQLALDDTLSCHEAFCSAAFHAQKLAISFFSSFYSIFGFYFVFVC